MVLKILKRAIKLILKISIFLFISAILIITYSKYIEPKILIAKNYNINLSQSKKEDLIRVVQFTDVQLGEFYTLKELEKVVEKINKQHPDIVVFTGDLIDKTSQYEDRDKVSKVLSKINVSIGKYAVWGNHDYGGGGHAYYEKIMSESGFEVLVNETVDIDINETKTMTISGLDEVMFGNPNYDIIDDNIKSENFNLLLLHEPDLINNISNDNINLALAGHSHGGQVSLPVLGSIITPPYAKEYTKGFYKINQVKANKLYVNSGIGNTRLPYRFMNIPQIAVFDINI